MLWKLSPAGWGNAMAAIISIKNINVRIASKIASAASKHEERTTELLLALGSQSYSPMTGNHRGS
jgi:hypothetical protein